MTEKEIRASLLEAFVIKSSVKQKVYLNTAQTFKILKKVLKSLEKEYINILRIKFQHQLCLHLRKKDLLRQSFR
jgi:hypothetical protein